MRRGLSLVAAVGGDGTCHEVVNGLIKDDRARSKQTAFCVLPFGTGSDLIKSLQTPKRLSEALWIAATGITLPSDVGKPTFKRGDAIRVRYFINVAGFGANGEVVRYANQSSKQLRRQSHLCRGASLKTIANYKHPNVRIHATQAEQSLNGKGSFSVPLLQTAHFVVGAWMSATKATCMTAFSTSPFSLNECCAATCSPSCTMAKSQPYLAPNIAQVDTLKATAPAHTTVYVDLDGELSGQLPVTIEILPRVLSIRGGWVRSPIAETQQEVT